MRLILDRISQSRVVFVRSRLVNVQTCNFIYLHCRDASQNDRCLDNRVRAHVLICAFVRPIREVCLSFRFDDEC